MCVTDRHDMTLASKVASELMSWSVVRLACVRLSVPPSVSALTFSLNIFFSETTYRILMKFYRNVPAMVLFRIF